jgi:hypothetical protein
MPISISQQPLVMNISTSPARLSQSGNGAKTLNLDIKEPLLEMQTNLPKVTIDQSQPFAEAGLKKIRAFMEDNTSYSKGIVSQGIDRIVNQGNEMINIHTGVDPIPDQALYNAYDMFEKSFNYAAVPTSRPVIDLVRGSVNYSFNQGKVTNSSQPQKVEMNYTPYQVNFSISQYNSVSFRYEKPKFDFMI